MLLIQIEVVADILAMLRRGRTCSRKLDRLTAGHNGLLDRGRDDRCARSDGIGDGRRGSLDYYVCCGRRRCGCRWSGWGVIGRGEGDTILIALGVLKNDLLPVAGHEGITCTDRCLDHAGHITARGKRFDG